MLATSGGLLRLRVDLKLDSADELLQMHSVACKAKGAAVDLSNWRVTFNGNELEGEVLAHYGVQQHSKLSTDLACLKLTVLCPTGQVLSIKMAAAASVKDIKAKIEGLDGMWPACKQHLVLAGKKEQHLWEGNTLADYNVQNEDTLILLPRPERIGNMIQIKTLKGWQVFFAVNCALSVLLFLIFKPGCFDACLWHVLANALFGYIDMSLQEQFFLCTSNCRTRLTT